MGWIWRILVLTLLVILLKHSLNTPAEAFITWSQGMDWRMKIQWQMEQWQRDLQDLPASMEAEIRRLIQDSSIGGNSEPI